MVIDENMAWEKFWEFNKKYFHNLLCPDFIEVYEMDTELGFCVDEGEDYIIGLTETWDSEKQFLSTLFHEMIHLWQFQVLHQEPDHYESFWLWQDTAAEAGLNFGVYGDTL